MWPPKKGKYPEVAAWSSKPGIIGDILTLHWASTGQNSQNVATLGRKFPQVGPRRVTVQLFAGCLGFYPGEEFLVIWPLIPN